MLQFSSTHIHFIAFKNICDTLKELYSMVHLQKVLNKRMQIDTTYEVEQLPPPHTKLSPNLEEKNLSLLPSVAIGSKQGERSFWLVCNFSLGDHFYQKVLSFHMNMLAAQLVVARFLAIKMAFTWTPRNLFHLTHCEHNGEFEQIDRFRIIEINKF